MGFTPFGGSDVLGDLDSRHNKINITPFETKT